MNADLWELAAVLFGGGFLGTALTAIFGRSKTKAETEKTKADEVKTLTEAAMSLVTPLHEEIGKLQQRVGLLEIENSGINYRLELAIRHIKELHDWIDIHLEPEGYMPPAPPSELGINT